MSNDLEHRLRQHLASVDDLPLRDVGPGDVAAAGVARVARRRRTAAGVAAAAVVAAGAAGLWAATVDRPDVDEPATVPAATAPVVTDAPAPPTTVTTSPARWTLLAADPRGAVLAPSVTWTGREAIVVGGRDVDGAPVLTATAYAPATDTWRAIADPPPLGEEPVAVWTGDQVVVVDAGTTHTYDLDADQWRTAAAPPAAVAAGALSVWTGSELFVWAPGGGPMAYDPAADAWHPMPAPPVESRRDAVSVWTGTEWIVWGGTAAGGGQLGDGAAYDPATATWRPLAPSSLTPRRASGAWTGTEVLIAAGSSGGDPVTGDGAFAHDDGAAYDPATDTWRPIAEGPAHPGFEPVWTGRLLLQFAKGGAHAYDPATDSWLECCGSAAPDAGAGIGGGPVWTGTTVLLLGSAAPGVGGAALTPPG